MNAICPCHINARTVPSAEPRGVPFRIEITRTPERVERPIQVRSVEKDLNEEFKKGYSAGFSDGFKQGRFDTFMELGEEEDEK